MFKINILMSYLVLIMYLGPVPVLADTQTGPLTIERIETGWGGEGLYLHTVEKEVVEGCDWPVLMFNTNLVMFNEIVSIALSAYHTKSKVVIRVVGCHGQAMNATAIAIVD